MRYVIMLRDGDKKPAAVIMYTSQEEAEAALSRYQIGWSFSANARDHSFYIVATDN